MMRIILGSAGLMLVWVMSCPLEAQPKERSLPKGHWPQEVTGRGLTEDSARDVALREAVKTVNALMLQQDPPLQSFVVTEEYVREHLLVDSGHAGKEIQVPGINERFKEWILTFKTDHNWWNDIVQRDQAAERKIRVEARRSLMSRIVTGMSILLLAGFGYVRLDQYTKYRHTTWLRVASVGAASLVLACWWLVLQSG